MSTNSVSASAAPVDTFGPMLRAWRRRRGASQLSLALQSGVSQRHVSFLESGRARPSREMVVQLSTALDVPLRQRNEMLLAAGFAPAYRESNLAAPELAPMRRPRNKRTLVSKNRLFRQSFRCKIPIGEMQILNALV